MLASSTAALFKKQPAKLQFYLTPLPQINWRKRGLPCHTSALKPIKERHQRMVRTEKQILSLTFQILLLCLGIGNFLLPSALVWSYCTKPFL
jgi:hypothetical protein